MPSSILSKAYIGREFSYLGNHSVPTSDYKKVSHSKCHYSFFSLMIVFVFQFHHYVIKCRLNNGG